MKCDKCDSDIPDGDKRFHLSMSNGHEYAEDWKTIATLCAKCFLNLAEAPRWLLKAA